MTHLGGLDLLVLLGTDIAEELGEEALTLALDLLDLLL